MRRSVEIRIRVWVRLRVSFGGIFFSYTLPDAFSGLVSDLWMKFCWFFLTFLSSLTPVCFVVPHFHSYNAHPAAFKFLDGFPFSTFSSSCFRQHLFNALVKLRFTNRLSKSSVCWIRLELTLLSCLSVELAREMMLVQMQQRFLCCHVRVAFW